MTNQSFEDTERRFRAALRELAETRQPDPERHWRRITREASDGPTVRRRHDAGCSPPRRSWSCSPGSQQWRLSNATVTTRRATWHQYRPPTPCQIRMTIRYRPPLRQTRPTRSPPRRQPRS